MIKDVEYAAFAQLSYLNWHKLNGNDFGEADNTNVKRIIDDKGLFSKIKTTSYGKWDKGDEGYFLDKNEKGHKIYDKSDSRIFWLYSENSENPDLHPKFDYLASWDFVCGYDHEKILKEKGCILCDEDSGFQASIFKKENKIMIAFRGTDEKADWLKANIPLGLNRYTDQLFCTAFLYDKAKELGPDNEIYITGHSLGGALAQFCFIYGGCIDSCITWNALGIGSPDKEFVLKGKCYNKCDDSSLKEALEELGYKSKKDWTSKCICPDGATLIKKFIEIKKIKEASRMASPSGGLDIKPISKKELVKLQCRLNFKLNVMYAFQSNFDKSIDNPKLLNVYFSGDLTPNIQNRAGTIIKIDEKIQNFDNDMESDRNIIGKNIVEFHSTHNFIPFFDKYGSLLKGILNETHIANAIKTMLLASDMSLNTIFVQRDSILGIYPLPDLVTTIISKPKGFYGSGTGSTLDEHVYKAASIYNHMLFVNKKSMSQYIHKWYDFDKDYNYIGKFANIKEIGGVTYEEPLKIRKL